jgi:hypothetical protein
MWLRSILLLSSLAVGIASLSGEARGDAQTFGPWRGTVSVSQRIEFSAPGVSSIQIVNNTATIDTGSIEGPESSYPADANATYFTQVVEAGSPSCDAPRTDTFDLTGSAHFDDPPGGVFVAPQGDGSWAIRVRGNYPLEGTETLTAPFLNDLGECVLFPFSGPVVGSALGAEVSTQTQPVQTTPTEQSFTGHETVPGVEGKIVSWDLRRTVAGGDTTPPVISGVPADLTVEATGPAGAVVTYANPTATDLVDGPVPVACVPASGSTFPLGDTTVDCTATDSSGNSASASFTVTVVDTTPPLIADVPADLTVEATGPAGAAVTYADPTASDLVDSSVPVACLPASGSTFPLGATTVDCTATDAHDNSASASFKVTVEQPGDLTPPVINVPSTITREATSSSGAVVTYSVSAKDKIDGPVSVTCLPASGSTFPVGDTTVNCSASDSSGNSAAASFKITVKDTKPPVISNLPASIIVAATGPAGAAVAYLSPTATDVVDGALPVTCLPVSGSTFPIGKTKVRCTATDAHGNAAAVKTFTVTVLDAVDQLRDLVNKVKTLPSLSDLSQKQLKSDLQKLLKLAQQNVTNPTSACGSLGSFIQKVQANVPPITSAEAADLVADARRIEAVIGCA